MKRAALGELSSQHRLSSSPGQAIVGKGQHSAPKNAGNTAGPSGIFSPSENPGANHKKKWKTGGGGRNSLLGGLPEGFLDDDEDEDTSGGVKNGGGRRRTASPGQIALFSSLLNASDDSTGNSNHNHHQYQNNNNNDDDDNDDDESGDLHLSSLGAGGMAIGAAIAANSIVSSAPTSLLASVVIPKNSVPVMSAPIEAAADEILFGFGSGLDILGGDGGGGGNRGGAGKDTRSSLAFNNRRQSILSPSMAALFENGGESEPTITTGTTTEAAFPQEEEAAAAAEIILPPTPKSASKPSAQTTQEKSSSLVSKNSSGKKAKNTSSSKNSVNKNMDDDTTTTSKSSNTVLNASSLRGPAHRVKTPGRSCLTGKATTTTTHTSITTAGTAIIAEITTTATDHFSKSSRNSNSSSSSSSSTTNVGSNTKAIPTTAGTAGRRTGGRRTVIFGSPQAAEYQTDAAPATGIKAMERSAAKARYRLGDEPELPFPSLDGAAVTTTSSTSTSSSSFLNAEDKENIPQYTRNTSNSTNSQQQATRQGEVVDDDDGSSSVESIETSNNSAMLRDWEEEASHLESSAARNKRARDIARARARVSLDGDDGNDNENNAPSSTRAGISSGGSSSPSSSAASKRSRRSSTSRRTKEMDEVAAEMRNNNNDQENDENNDANTDDVTDTAVLSSSLMVPAPPTPMRRARRVSSSEGGADSIEKNMNSSMMSTTASPEMQDIINHIPASTTTTSSGTHKKSNKKADMSLGSMVIGNSAGEPSPILCGFTSSMLVTSHVMPSLSSASSTLIAPKVVGSAPIAPGSARKNKNRPQLVIEAEEEEVEQADVVQGSSSTTTTLAPVTATVSVGTAAVAKNTKKTSAAAVVTKNVDTSVASMDRTADTADREAFFAMLNDSGATTGSIGTPMMGAVTGVGSKKSSNVAVTAADAGDITTMLQIDGAGIPSSFPGTATVTTGTRAGGLLAAGGFGAGKLLDISNTNTSLQQDGSSMMSMDQTQDHTTALAPSLGAMLAMEEGGGRFGVAAVSSTGNIKNNNKQQVAPTTNPTDDTNFSINMTGFGLGAGLADEDIDHTYASIDGVPRYAGGQGKGNKNNNNNDDDDDEGGENDYDAAASVAPDSPEVSPGGGQPLIFGGGGGQAGNMRRAQMRMGMDGSLHDISSMEVDATRASDDSTHSDDSVSTADVVDREMKLLQGAGLTPNRNAMLAATRSAASTSSKPTTTSTAVITTASVSTPVVVAPGPGGQVTSAMMATMVSALAAMQGPVRVVAPQPSTPGVVSVPMSGIGIGTPGRGMLVVGGTAASVTGRKASTTTTTPKGASSVAISTTTSTTTSSFPAASVSNAAVGITASSNTSSSSSVSSSSSSAAFGFEDFCAAAGLRIFSAETELSTSSFFGTRPSNGSTSSTASSSSSNTNTEYFSNNDGVTGNANNNAKQQKKDRRRSSIAVMARMSMANRRESLLNPSSEQAIGASLVNQFVLQPERAQMDGASEIVREQVRQAAPVLEAYSRELDAEPPAVLQEVARAHSIVAAFDLEGSDSCGYTQVQIDQAEDILSKLRDLRATHEMNARVVYLRWRIDMANQRVASLSDSNTALAARLKELQAADTQLIGAVAAANALCMKLAAAREASQGLQEMAVELKSTCKDAHDTMNAASALTASVGRLEADYASVASTKGALLARVEQERAAIAALEKEAADGEAEMAAIGAGSSGSSGSGSNAGIINENAIAEKYIAGANAAAEEYESLCAASGWRITSLSAGSGSGNHTISFTYTHPDQSCHVVGLSSSSGSFTCTSVVHVPAAPAAATSSSSRVWGKSGGVAEYYKYAVNAAIETFTSSSSTTEDVKRNLSKLTTSLCNIRNLCNEVSTMQGWYAIRFNQVPAAAGNNNSNKWRLSADFGDSSLKFRVNFDVNSVSGSNNVSASSSVGSSPQVLFSPIGFSIMWVYGDKSRASEIVHTIQSAQATFAASVAAKTVNTDRLKHGVNAGSLRVAMTAAAAFTA